MGEGSKYYEDTRYLTLKEVRTFGNVDAIIAKSFEANRPLYELYRADGTRIGKLDPGRGWVAKIVAKHTPVDKDTLLRSSAIEGRS